MSKDKPSFIESLDLLESEVDEKDELVPITIRLYQSDLEWLRTTFANMKYNKVIRRLVRNLHNEHKAKMAERLAKITKPQEETDDGEPNRSDD